MYLKTFKNIHFLTIFLDIYKVITITKINKIVRCGNKMEILFCTKLADSSGHYNHNFVRKKTISVWIFLWK